MSSPRTTLRIIDGSAASAPNDERIERQRRWAAQSTDSELINNTAEIIRELTNEKLALHAKPTG